MRISDRVAVAGFPDDYPLVIVAIAGGRMAMGSPLWPKGATRAISPADIRSINGAPAQFEAIPTKQRRRAA